MENRIFSEDCPECIEGNHHLCKKGAHSKEECKCIEIDFMCHL